MIGRVPGGVHRDPLPLAEMDDIGVGQPDTRARGREPLLHHRSEEPVADADAARWSRMLAAPRRGLVPRAPGIGWYLDVRVTVGRLELTLAGIRRIPPRAEGV